MVERKIANVFVLHLTTDVKCGTIVIEREVIRMIEIKCPKCESKEVEYIDSDHQWISVMDGEGCVNGIYHCPKCKISFGAWADFKIEITECKIDWIESDEEGV